MSNPISDIFIKSDGIELIIDESVGLFFDMVLKKIAAIRSYMSYTDIRNLIAAIVQILLINACENGLRALLV